MFVPIGSKAPHCGQSGASILSQWAKVKAQDDPNLTWLTPPTPPPLTLYAHVHFSSIWLFVHIKLVGWIENIRQCIAIDIFIGVLWS